MEISSSTHWNNRLRQERIARNWRQQDLADQLGTTVVTIRRWEHGRQQPGAYFRVKLCALFGISPQELFGERRSLEQKRKHQMSPMSLRYLHRSQWAFDR